MTGSHISLFSGIGMTDYAAMHSGYETVLTAEADPFCRDVLKARFPHAVHLDDVRDVRSNVDYGLTRVPRPLLISGGFPCQDVAAPGTGAGLNGSRSGLWIEFKRVIGEFRPDRVLIENSPNLRSRGLDRVLRDLCELGYDARWDCLPAAAFGAPHLRDRIWIVAWPHRRDAELWKRADYCIRTYNDYIIPTHGIAVKVTKLPRAGTMIGRFITEDPPRAAIRDAKYGNLATGSRWIKQMLPTVTKSDGSGGPGRQGREGGKNLRTVIHDGWGNSRINPAFAEWMMGVPRGWSDPDTPNRDLRPSDDWSYWPNVPPTVALHQRNRGRRIQALGNGLVPVVAQYALTELSPDE